jgi:glycosyltransferase involved in cell wall biosynthesis
MSTRKRYGDLNPNKPSALLLSPEAPYPPIGGGALRTASLVEYLGRRFELDIVVFRQPGAPDPSVRIPAHLVRRATVIDLPPTGRGFLSRSTRNLRRLAKGAPPLNDRFAGFEAQIERELAGRTYNLAIAEHFWVAGYRDVLAAHAKHVALDLHNIESILFERMAAHEPWPASAMHRRFGEICRGMEERLLPEFSFLMATSDKDRESIAALAPKSRVIVYPNTIPLQAVPRVPRENAIIFTGNLEYHPNTGAVRYFHDKIWPLVSARKPELVWKIAGINPHAVRGIVAGSPRVELIGPVEDSAATIASALVAVIPLLAGSGTRLKILDAWAAETPVISTAIGAEGLAGRDGIELLKRDGAASFADAICELLDSPSRAAKLGRAGRVLYEREYTWGAAWERLDTVEGLY